jgi:sugar lactone lactonase YvrE
VPSRSRTTEKNQYNERRNMKKTSLCMALVLALALVLTIGFIRADIVHADSGVNYAFTPNSGEASVSRVDLISMTEVARYYTAPRVGDEVDLVGNLTPGTPNTIDPRDWRTSRIVIDSGSNAWVVNTGADGTSLQGSIVRIQADTTGLTTHAYPHPVMDFGTDEAVQVFLVGAPGDMPRAIVIDSDGYIWVGFYSGAQLMKYEYNEAAQTLTAVAGPFFPAVAPDNRVIRYYDMDFAPNGRLFVSSRGSTPTRTPRQEGIWAFDPTTQVFTRETTWNPYAVLIAEDGTVYATAYSNLLRIRDKDTGVWSSVTITGSSQNRGMAFDDQGRIWIASTVGTIGGTVVYSHNITSGTPGPTYTLTSGTTPVGVGKDAAGNIWIICRSDAMAQGWLEGFDPVTLANVGAIQVGFRPYAYRGFVMPFQVDARISVVASAINLVGESHDFIVTVERNPGAGWLPAIGVVVNGTTDFGTLTGSPAATDTDGRVTFTVNSTLPGTATVHASATVDVGGVSIGVSTDGYGKHDVDNQKTWVDARISIGAGGINLVGEPHDFTVTVEMNPGTGWVPAEDVAVNGTTNLGTLTGSPAMTDAGGRVTFAANSTLPGTATVHASAIVDVGGVPIGVATDGYGAHAIDNQKTWFGLYDICGLVYDADTGDPLEGTEVFLEKEVQGAWVIEATTTTDADGEYCFTGLEAGAYRVTQVLQRCWVQVSPASPGYHNVTLPNGEPVSYDFENRNTCTGTTVGGTPYPVNKVAILTRWIALLAVIIAGVSLLVLRRRRSGRACT